MAVPNPFHTWAYWEKRKEVRKQKSPCLRAFARALASVTWNYTTYLNIVFLVVAAVLVGRFFRTGGAMMLKMMGGSPESTAMGSH